MKADSRQKVLVDLDSVDFAIVIFAVCTDGVSTAGDGGQGNS